MSEEEYNEAAAKVYARLVEGVVVMLLVVGMLIASIYYLATRPAGYQPNGENRPAAGARDQIPFHRLRLAIPPGRVRFHHQVWRIEFVPACHTDGRSNKNFLGMTHFDSHLIELRSDLSGSEQAETLYHELEHVVTGDEFPLERMSGHAAIYRLEPMAELLGKNPQLAAYFREAEQ